VSPPADGTAIVPAATTAPAPAQAAPAPVPSQSAQAAAPVAATPSGDAIGARTAAGRELIAAGSSARYAVQLMVTDARERGYLESYLAEAGRVVEPARLFLVPAGSPQSPRVGVLLGGFEARAQAADALAHLPEALRQFKPYVRSIESVREEARRAQGS
jgi:septal ring-binding cell division protein DamX